MTPKGVKGVRDPKEALKRFRSTVLMMHRDFIAGKITKDSCDYSLYRKVNHAGNPKNEYFDIAFGTVVPTEEIIQETYKRIAAERRLKYLGNKDKKKDEKDLFPEIQILTEQECIDFLKSKGYRILKPKQEWEEV